MGSTSNIQSWPGAPRPVPVEADGATIKRMFAEVAPRYDFLNHLLSLQLDHWWRRRLVRLALAGRRVERVLDLCTGTGDLALLFARRLPRSATVIGLDFCPPMIARAARKRGTTANARFGIGDATRVPLGSDRFDVVSVAFGIRNVDDRTAALQEIRRVLRPGGALYILEFSMPRRPLVRRLYGYYFTHVLPRLGRLIARTQLDAYAYLPASVDRFPTADEFARVLTACGFAGVTHSALGMGAVTLYRACKPALQEPAP